LEKRAEQVLPGSEGDGERGRKLGLGGEGWMAQTMYAHMNKRINKKGRKILKINQLIII
jgi:hypothetical protein